MEHRGTGADAAVIDLADVDHVVATIVARVHVTGDGGESVAQPRQPGPAGAKLPSSELIGAASGKAQRKLLVLLAEDVDDEALASHEG